MGKRTKSLSCVLGLGSYHMRISNFHDVKWLKKTFQLKRLPRICLDNFGVGKTLELRLVKHQN